MPQKPSSPNRYRTSHRSNSGGYRHSLRVCIDAGRGGCDRGSVVAGIQEKTIILQHALGLDRELRRKGHRTILTRSNDQDIAAPGTSPEFRGVSDRRERAAIANEFGAHCVIGLLGNSSISTHPHGVWVAHDNSCPMGARLAGSLLQCFHQITDLHACDGDGSDWSRSPDISQQSILRDTEMPTVLVRLGFLTNPNDLARLSNPLRQRTAIRAIVRAIESWARSEDVGWILPVGLSNGGTGNFMSH